ncbi:MAG: trypsin-like peptidase domain-containing protein [Spirochaetales bacterium]|nr:trypsin-like peptidase domain-containing protein [Spirochaetales bacterium]
MDKLFQSKKFLYINLVLVGLIAGFLITFIAFSATKAITANAGADAAAGVEEKKVGGQIPVETAVEIEMPKEGPNSIPQPYREADNQQGTERTYSVPEEMQNSFRKVANDVLPVVVELRVVEVTTQLAPPSNGWPWNFLLPPGSRDDEPEEREFRSSGLGSGVIVRQERDKYYVLTNDHVAGEADEIEVVLNDGRSFPGTLVGKDDRKDLAVVLFESSEKIPVAVLGDSDELYVGDWVFAVGSPFGYVSSVTFGVVSAKQRKGPRENISDFIQTDAAINQGNSGGALVNLRGEVIGINTWIATNTGMNAGLGFALPINNAKKVIDDLIDHGEVKYGWLGVSILDPSEEVREEMMIGQKPGSMVYNVYLDSPADRGGLLPGDFITGINGISVEDTNELVLTVGDLPPNKKASFSIIRYGKALDVEVRIAVREDTVTIISRNLNIWPSMTPVPVTAELKEQMELSSGQKGVLLSVIDKGRAYNSGFRSGDLVIRINDRNIENAMDFYQALNDKGSSEFDFYLLREGVVEYKFSLLK